MPGRRQNGRKRLQLERLEERLLLDGGGLGSVAPEWFQVLAAPSEQSSLPGAASTVRVSWDGGAVEARAGFWIIQFTDQATATVRSVAETARLLPGGKVDFQVVKGLGQAGQVLVRTPGASAGDVKSWLGKSTSVAWFEPDAVVRVAQVPNDPGFPQQWGLDNTGQSGGTPGADISAAAAWDITTGSASVVIGIIDTGVDFAHPDLAPNMWTNPGEIAGNGKDDDANGFVDDVYGYDFADNDADPGPGTGHGTHVAGIAAGAGNNGTGAAGAAWQSSIMALKMFDDDGSGALSAAVSALNYAAMMRKLHGVNIRVTNNSWVVDLNSSSLRSAVKADGDAGIITVAAAGNGSYNVDAAPLYPAAFDLNTVISVAGSDRNDHLADFSVWGPTTVDLAAPAANVHGPTPGGGYNSGSGVSYAAPFVTGVVALAWSAAPDATPAQVRAAVLGGVDPVPSLAGKMVTGGRLNALNTLQALALRVAGSTPAAGGVVTAPPTQFVIDFSLPLDPASVAAGDLQVNGVAANAFTIVDADTVRFTYTTTPVVNQGAQVMHVGAGAVRQASGGRSNSDWTAGFRFDSLALAVTAAGPRTGRHVGAAPSSIVLDFNEPVRAASIGTDDLLLSTGTVTGASALDADTVAYTVSGLPAETWISWSLQPGALTDAFGSPGAGFAGEFTIDGPDVARYDLTGAPAAIPDAGTVTSQITVSDSFQIADIDVLMDITHARDADLRATLIAPDGTRVPLFDRVGGSGAGFDDTLLDADAPTAVTAGIGPFAARYRPQGNLAGLEGRSVQGAWKLELSDLAAGQAGTLQGWSLYVTRPETDGPRVVSQVPTGAAATAPASVTFGFSEPMDTASFSAAADVVSFTGPLGDLAARVTGFAWVDAQTLRVDFQQQADNGDYQMVIGPQILDRSSNAMDQDQDGANGVAPGDRYTAAFSFHGTATVSVALLASSDTGVSNSDYLTNDTTPTYAVTVSGAGTVKIDWQGDGTTDLTGSVPGAGTYQFTPAFALPGGAYPTRVTFTGTDLQTAIGQAPTVIDVTPPPVPLAPTLAPISDTGASNSDRITNDTSPTIDVGDPGGYYRLARGGVQVSADYAVDTYYTDIALADGAYAYTLRAVDAAGNASAPSPALMVTVDTTGPSVTATSPSGTAPSGAASAPVSAIGITFADANGLWSSLVADKANYALYSSGGDGAFTEGNQVNLTGRVLGTAYDGALHRVTLALDAPLGDEVYQVRVLSSVRDAAGNTLNRGAGYSFTFTVDSAAPTLAVALDTPTIAGNLVTDSTPTYDVTVSEPGRIAIDWQGDGTADLSALVGAAGTYQYTPSSPLSAGLYPVHVGFTDTAGHQVSAESPTSIATMIQQGSATVTLISVGGAAQFSPANVAVKFSKTGAISSITLGGTGSMEGLGILISGTASVGSIKDARTGPLGDLAFIASGAPIKAVALKSGLTGYNLNGLSVGSLVIPPDVDGDGDSTDLTALYATGPVGTFAVSGDVEGDVWIGGADGKGLALASFTSKYGGYNGDLTALGDVGAISLGGDLGSSINVSGVLRSLVLKTGSMTAGARVYAGRGLTALTVGGSLVGGADEDGLVQVLAPTIGSVKITGSVTRARILAGADLGADWAPGGTGADADEFQRGSISKLSIGGGVRDSLIGAGLIAHDGAFDLEWLDANSAFIDGSLIGSATIVGPVTSSASGGIPFGIGAYQLSKLKVGAGSDPSLTVTEV